MQLLDLTAAVALLVLVGIAALAAVVLAAVAVAPSLSRDRAASAWPAASPSAPTTAACTSPDLTAGPPTRTRPDFWRRSGRAPPLRVPAALGRPRPARPRQQRHLRRLPPGGAGRHAPHPRPRRPGPSDLAEGVVVVRHEVHYVAPLTFGFEPVSDRVLGHRDPRRDLHDGLRDLRRGPDGERTVYLRATTVLTPYVFATERPRRLDADERETLEPLPRAGRAGSPAGRAAASPTRGRPLPGARPVLRRRRLRARQQREVLRVLPGGAHPADASRSGARAGQGRPRSSSPRPTSTTGVPILFRAEPYDC